MKKFILCLLFSLCIGTMPNLYASHFAGQELSYEQLDSCTYRIYFTFYFDCSGAATQIYPPLPAYPYWGPNLTFTVLGCSTLSINPLWRLYDSRDISPLCSLNLSSCTSATGVYSGVTVHRIYTDVNLCGLNCTSVKAVYENCCRNYNLTNGAAGEFISLETNIDLTIDNSSPRFLSPPIFYMSPGQNMTFSQAAIDFDGDSLVYSFVPCMASATQAVTYNTGYSPTAPMGPTWNCSIDAQTGEVTILANPGNIVRAPLGIQVDEYRNGVNIGNTKRDIMVMVVNTAITTPNYVPSAALVNVNSIGTQNPPYQLKAEAGHLISFEVNAMDLDTGQTLGFASNLYYVDTFATLTANTNTSPMTLTFSWTPDSTYRGKTIPVWIDVFDDHCTLNGHTYIVCNITIDSHYVYGTVTPSDCSLSTGAIDITAGGGVPPYYYSWSNGATTEDISNLASGVYIVNITDAGGGFAETDTFYVNSTNLTAYFGGITPACNNPNGMLSISAVGGTAPYTYTWSNGVVDDTINNLAVGNYFVDIYDATSCVFHADTFIAANYLDSCFSIIEGTLYFDANGNCVQDASEAGIVNQYINLTPGGAIFTDVNGHYAFMVVDTGAYLLQSSLYTNPNVSSTCLPANYEIQSHISLLGKDSLYNDFPVVIQPDIKVALHEQPYQIGCLRTTFISCYNLSYNLANASLTYMYDSLIKPLVISPSPLNHDTINRTITWNIIDFTPNITKQFIIHREVTNNAVLGDVINSHAELLPIANDVTPANNQANVTKVVVNAFDPNYKEVSPQGETVYGLIPPTTQALEYTIHFQNTGNAAATTVILKDTVEVNVLDISSTEIQMTSHACNITVENDSILVFTFNNINLPDSFANEPESHGFVKFGIQLKDSLPFFTTIANNAAIYFDFNPPIITNTTINTIYPEMDISITTSLYNCPGDSIFATVVGGKVPYTFDWNTGTQVSNNYSGLSQILSPSFSNIYNVTVTDSYGISQVQSFFVINSPLADATFAYNITGNFYHFEVNNPNNLTYFWDFGNGQTSNTAIDSTVYLQNGIYTVSLIVTDICGRSDTSTQTILLNVNNESSLFQQQTQLSPNPTKDNIQLSFPNEKQQAYTLTIFDINGKAVKTIANIFNNQIVVSVRDWASGTYFWELKGEESAGGKFVKE